MFNQKEFNEMSTMARSWIAENLFTLDRLAQYAIVILGLILAFYISKWVRTRLQLPEQDEQGYRMRHLLFRVARRLIFPVTLFLWISLATLIFELLELPHRPLNLANSLVVAWALIRLASSLISNATISHVVSSIIWAIAALNILGVLPKTIAWLEGIKLGSEKNALSMYDIISSTLSVAIFVWIAMAVAAMIERAIHNNANLSASTEALLTKISRFLLITLAFLIGLNTVGIDLTAFAVFGGAMGVGIGLGLQKVFSNLIAGIILLLDKSIKPGDTIVLNGRYGKVNSLSARYVSMLTRDGTEYLIPNDELINTQVENWSYSNSNIRLSVPVGIHYRSDVRKAISLCLAAVRETPRTLKTPEPVCLLKEFGDNSVNLEQRFWICDPMNGCNNVKSEILLRIWDKFHENNIEIPYPQRDLHLRSVDPDCRIRVEQQTDI